MPKRVKKKRALPNSGNGGADAGWEEYYDYLFPDEVKAVGTLKLLQNVQAWKKRKMGGDAAAASSSSSSTGEEASAP